MYGIFTYIWSIFMVNVGKYSIHGASGLSKPPIFGWKNQCDLWLVGFLEPRSLTALPGDAFSGRILSTNPTNHVSTPFICTHLRSWFGWFRPLKFGMLAMCCVLLQVRPVAPPALCQQLRVWSRSGRTPKSREISMSGYNLSIEQWSSSVGCLGGV